MLGYEHLHKLDIQDSRELLLRTYRNFQPGKLEADGGSMRALGENTDWVVASTQQEPLAGAGRKSAQVLT